MTRPSRAIIDLDALRHNYQLARRLHGGRALAVIKANAYGHGAVVCARALAPDADGFAVAFVDEARELREGGIRKPVLILEGAFDAEEQRLARDLDLWLVVHHEAQIRLLEQCEVPAAGMHLWLKVDTGMHRAGFALDEVVAAYRRLQETGKAASITFMTHFARADEPDAPMTLEQLRRFDAATEGLPGERSVCNSAGLLSWPQARRDWARAGIMLYGVEPAGGERPDLQPVMSLQGQVFAVRELDAGEPVGYGATYIAPSRRRIGLVCLGYADGYPREAPTGTPVAVDGRRAALVGRVSMDMLTVDLTDLPATGVGSVVELWGATIPVNTVASSAGRSAYELLCGVRRVPLRYRGVRSDAGTTQHDRVAVPGATPAADGDSEGWAAHSPVQRAAMV